MSNLLKESFIVLLVLCLKVNGQQQSNQSVQPKFVTLVTNMGSIKIELFWSAAPKTCKNFAQLSKQGYYNNVIFHRIIDGFMIQGGDPTGTGRGGESIYGAKFEDEFNSNYKHDSEGVLSMANAGPDTNGSQFFITLAPTPHLNGKHTVFGKVRSGIDVVRKMGKVKVDRNDKPIETVRILRTQLSNN